MENQNLENISLDEILEGIVPLPTESNLKSIEIIKEVKNELDIDVARIDNKYTEVLGKKGKYLYLRKYNSDTGKLHQEDSFKGKTSFDEDIICGYIIGVGGIAIGLSALALPLPKILKGMMPLAGFLIPFLIAPSINHLRPSIRKRSRKTTEYEDMISEFKKENIDKLNYSVSKVNIFQGNLMEISEEFEKDLVRIDTGQPETYIRAKNPLELRVKAYLMGADAIVHYQPGSSIGTPVKYKD